MITKEEFLKKYGGLNFDNVKFRPGVAFTTPFGLDNTFDAFRIHNAIDRGNNGIASDKNPIYCPFDAEPEWFADYAGGFGSMLRLKTAYGFEVRIMHMNDVEPVAKGKALIKAGTLIGYAGNKGVGTATHTHVEIVSSEKTSELLDSILLDKYAERDVTREVTLKDAVRYITDKELTKDFDAPAAAWSREISKRGIQALYTYHCYRVDYHSGKLRTFYSSQALFGI
jgi:murein DD-endopeptidase MepM/ murein hydrolase activator NlpD